jgi:hypothetical protein
MNKSIILGAALVAIAVAGCHGEEPARSPTPTADLEGIADKPAQGLEKNGSTINASGETSGDKAVESREEHPAPADKPQPEPPPPEPKP